MKTRQYRGFGPRTSQFETNAIVQGVQKDIQSTVSIIYRSPNGEKGETCPPGVSLLNVASPISVPHIYVDPL